MRTETGTEAGHEPTVAHPDADNQKIHVVPANYDPSHTEYGDRTHAKPPTTSTTAVTSKGGPANETERKAVAAKDKAAATKDKAEDKASELSKDAKRKAQELEADAKDGIRAGALVQSSPTHR
jgi:hypothetical protein